MSASSPSPGPRRRRSSLRSRLFRAVGIALATLLLVCALATAAVTRLGGAIGLILRENYVSVVACQEMNEALEGQDSAALFSASGRSEIAARVLTEQRTAFDRAFAREAGNVTLPGEGARVQELGALYGDYVHEVDRVLAEPMAARIAGYFQDLLPRVDAG
jgi:two-component system, NtrC family, sensor histidine kinase KinB